MKSFKFARQMSPHILNIHIMSKTDIFYIMTLPFQISPMPLILKKLS